MKKLLTLTCGVLILIAMLLPAFTLTAFAAEKTLKTDKTTYTEGEPIMVTATGEGKDWVGIFKKGELLGSAQSIYWYYVDQDGNRSGTAKNIFESDYCNRHDLESLPAGDYTLYLVADDGETMDKMLASVDITVVPMSKTLKTDKTVYTEGDPIMVTATGSGKDWVAIYKKDEKPGSGVDSIYWYYVDMEGTASGDTKNLRDGKLNEKREADADLPAGEYTVYLLENDGYDVLDSVNITIQKPDQELYGYVQTKSGKSDGFWNVRVLVEASAECLSGHDRAVLTVTFTDDQGQSVVYTASADTAYTSVTACGETVYARAGYGYLGAVITDVPSNVVSVSATVSFDGQGDIALGSAEIA